MNRHEFLSLIERLVMAHSPCRNEGEIDSILVPEFKAFCGDVTQDAAGNILARFPGNSPKTILITAHKDEVGMIVKRVEPSGRLRIAKVGGITPWKYGEGVVDILGDLQVIPGILSFGSMHCSQESRVFYEALEKKPLTWDMVCVETKRTDEELKQAGVHIGTKVVIGKHRKKPLVIGDYLCSYAVDDKALLAVMIALAQGLAVNPVDHPVVIAATTGEEIGAVGANWLTLNRPVDLCIALEIAPAIAEYQIENGPNPVVLFQDTHLVYDELLSRQIMRIGQSLGMNIQPACLSTFGSDASITGKNGHAARSVCLCCPTDNTHGYEITSVSSLENLVRLLQAFLKQVSL